jgi:hypothetical protein
MDARRGHDEATFAQDVDVWTEAVLRRVEARPPEIEVQAPVGAWSLSQRSPSALASTAALIGDVDLARLRRTDHLGGLIHEYRMAA